MIPPDPPPLSPHPPPRKKNNYFRYSNPEDRILNRVVPDISFVHKKITLILPDSIETGTPVKSESVRAVYPFPKRQILDPSTLKDFADDNFKFDENERKLSGGVENTVGEGEIARYEQFLLFPMFSKDLYCRHVKTRACLGKG